MHWSLARPGTQAMGSEAKPAHHPAKRLNTACQCAQVQGGVTMNLTCIAHLDQLKDLNEILATQLRSGDKRGL